MYGVLLASDHPTLPLSELKAVVELSGADILYEDGNFVLVDKKFQWGRLALTRMVFIVKYCGKNPEQAAGCVRPGGTFAVRIEKNKKLERKIGKELSRHAKVDLEKPEDTYFGTSRNQFYFGRVVWERKSFEKRKVQNRPYFHPTSLHPKYARVLVNLSGVKRGWTLLDPFCGTGGILIEAALVGASAHGRDIDKDMVRGSRDNLDFYKLEASIRHGDARNLRGKYDAMATDPPYGRASYFSGNQLQKLYDESLKSMAKALKPGRKIVLTVPDTVKLRLPAGLTALETHSQRVHKSLKRYFYVLRKAKERHD